jgi:hygromycin-B 4-O-kinase
MERMKFLEKFKLLDKKQLAKLESSIQKISKLKGSAQLNHGDLRLKNMIVNKKGKILAFIDWEHSLSSVTPLWDLSIALHDLSIDAKHQFLHGYGIDPGEFEESAEIIKMFNILNYVPVLEGMMRRRKKIELALYKLRLNGHLDLFRF